MQTNEMLDTIVNALEDKKAKEIQVIHIEEITILTDYFVICTGTSTTHMKALADAVDESFKKVGQKYLHQEGYNSAKWILQDYGSVVVHIMSQEDREFYNIERLWQDGVKKNR